MNIFPRLVWHEIYQFLSYVDRCSFRATCRYLSRFKNNELLAYWLKRDDPIILNLGTTGLQYSKLYYGIYVEKLHGINWQTIDVIQKGGNFENFISKIEDHTYYSHYPHMAYKRGHTKILNFILENKSYEKYSYEKYCIMNSKFDNITTLSTYEDGYYFALKHNVPIEILKKNYIEYTPGRIKYSHIKLAIRNNYQRVHILLKLCTLSSHMYYSLLMAAAKKNLENLPPKSFILENLLIDLFKQTYVSHGLNQSILFVKICRLPLYLIFKFLGIFSATEIYLSILKTIKRGHIWTLRKILLSEN